MGGSAGVGRLVSVVVEMWGRTARVAGVCVGNQWVGGHEPCVPTERWGCKVFIRVIKVINE